MIVKVKSVASTYNKEEFLGNSLKERKPESPSEYLKKTS